MNDLQIFEQVAREQGKLRVVQLADRMNVELEDARARLLGLVAVGDLVEADGFAPNGLATKTYGFSETFKRSDLHATVMRKVEAATFGDPGMTKVDRAIAFVREKGTATSAELHALLGLGARESASNYLASPLRDGRLVKDGKTWTLGTGKAIAPPASEVLRKSSFNRTIAKKGPVAQFPKTAQPDDAPVPADPGIVEVKPAGLHVNLDERDTITVNGSVAVDGRGDMNPLPAFRAGLWSDGVLELQRDGKTIAKLQQSEGEQLAEFMQRMSILVAA
jgi:hypothetical protein